MLDIEVKNFQSIEHEHVQVEGFTALVGRSNIGKSALIRAIQYALTNESGTDFVRHGAKCARRTKGTKTCKCACSVQIKTDGLDLLWEKGDAINRYTVDGKVYDKVDRGTPEFLHSIALAPIEIGDDKVCIHVSDQFNPIFLLNRRGSEVAELISDVGNLDRINEAMRRAEKDRREALSTRNIREKDVASLKDKLVPYQGLDRDLGKAAQVEVALGQVKVVEGCVQQISTYITQLVGSITTIQALTKATAAPVPETRPVLGAAAAAVQSAAFWDKHEQKAAEAQRLAGVETITPPDLDTFQQAVVGARQAESLHDRYIQKQADVQSLAGAEQLQAPDLNAFQQTAVSAKFLGDILIRLTQRTAEYKGLSAIEQVKVPDWTLLQKANLDLAQAQDWFDRAANLKSLFQRADAVSKAVVPDLTPVITAQGKLTTLGPFTSRYEALTKAVADLERSIQEAELEEKSVRDEFQMLGAICPTCARPYPLEAQPCHA